MKGRKEEGRLSVKIEARERYRMKRKSKGKELNFGMFCTICAPEIGREIAVC